MVLFNRALFNGFSENIKTFISKDYELKFADEIDLTISQNQKNLLSRINTICDTIKKTKCTSIRAATRRKPKQKVETWTTSKEVTISHDYIKTLFKKIMTDVKHEKLDIIFVLEKKINDDKPIDRIIAFLITEIGECDTPEYKHIPVLNLISVARRFEYNESGKLINRIVYPGVSRILFYMYLTALMKNGYDYGLLELAHNYSNLGGLCLYNKFGFREDISIKTSTCFFDGLYKYENDDYKLNSKGKKIYDNDLDGTTLPMKVDISKLTIAKLNDALIHGDAIDVEEKLDPLCTKEYKPIKINSTMTKEEIKQILEDNRKRAIKQKKFTETRVKNLTLIKNAGMNIVAKKLHDVQGRKTKFTAVDYLSRLSQSGVNDLKPYIISSTRRRKTSESKITKKKTNRRNRQLKRVSEERANTIANRRRVSSRRATAKITSGLSNSRRSKRISSIRATKRKSRSSSNNKSRKRV